MSLTYVTTLSSGSDLSTYTFSGASIGTADSNRVLLLAVVGRSTVGSSISSVTVGGVSATRIAGSDFASGTVSSCVFYGLAVPTGTTADIVVNFASSQLRAGVAIFSAIGIDIARLTDSAASGGALSNGFSFDLDNAAGDLVLAAAYTSTSATSAAWTGLTGVGDHTIIEGGTALTLAGGVQPTAEAARAVTVTWAPTQGAYTAYAAIALGLRRPTNTTAPVASLSGGVLSCTTGVWDSYSNGTATYAYQWQSYSGSWSNISGATSSSYTPSGAGTYRCVVAATNNGGNDPASDTASNEVAFVINNVFEEPFVQRIHTRQLLSY